MEIKDSQHKFLFRLDQQRNILYYEQIGIWSVEDFDRFYDKYKEMVKYINKKPWAVLDNLKGYKPSTQVTPEMMNSIVNLAIENGISCAAILLESATLKMQLNRSNSEKRVQITYFDDEEEAFQWLESKGF